ncbi:MAG: thioredoxin domain-containing protein [Chloroflexi bacterium]|nr:thioredoxin domain-containing protein [Chloroflexota bacterium]
MTSADSSQPHSNRLADETSPYLLQHARNPVDWFPWGPEALARAKLLDRPIFLSIGYAACHWCHVMERESFEDEATAGVLNDGFVAIKVDREERPDLDQLYMGAVQAMTGSGGWPMSVFLTPEGRPFYGGTYFPDAPRHGLPSFRQVLDGVRTAWRSDRGRIEQAGARLAAALADQVRPPAGQRSPTPDLLDTAVLLIDRGFDATTGGWGGAPKFPQPMTIEFLLGRSAATGDPRAIAVASRALDALARGGIHDQLGGGFHRYATDAHWLVPHFEQMLYDNAQLARAYLRGWAVLGNDAWRETGRGVLDAIVREFTTADGAFAASLDADTAGVEGATFTWDAAEVRAVLGENAPIFATAYGVTDGGNWEGRTILSRIRSDRELAQQYDLAEPEVRARLAAARARLFVVRRGREQPARDDKALAAWNGLAIDALATGARLLDLLGNDDDRVAAARYLAAATTAAATITEGLLRPDGHLGRSWKGGRASGAGVLEDYAMLAEGLLVLYEAGHEERWFQIARDLADQILLRFGDPDGGFFDTASDHERLIARPRDIQDNATPSGNAAATLLLLRMAALTGEARFRTGAEQAIRTVVPYLGSQPTAFARWLAAVEFSLSAVAEVAIVGDPADPATRALLAVVARTSAAPSVLAVSTTPEGSVVPLMAGWTRVVGARATAYVCRGFSCRLPVTDPEALAEQLRELQAAV